MKKILLFTLSLVMTASLSFAQTTKGAKTKEEVKKEIATKVAGDNADTQTLPAEGPVMTFEQTEIDYGVIEQHSDPLRIFHFTNTGIEPLVIKHAKGSCGCTVPTYPKEPILPGEAGIIEVRYDTKRVGKFTKRVTLTTNEVSSTRVLTIKGETFKKKAEPAGVPSTQPSILTPANKGN